MTASNRPLSPPPLFRASNQLPFLCADDSFAQIIFSLVPPPAGRMTAAMPGAAALEGREREAERRTKSDANCRDWN